MSKTNIREIVPKAVSVEEPKIVEIHRALGGSQAMSGNPKGSEAKPELRQEGFKLPPGGK